MVALLATATLASAELKAWNQEEVTAAAAQLMEKTADLRASLRKQLPPTLGQPGKRAFHQLRDDVTAVDQTARRLHTALAEGAGLDETFPTYQRMLSSVRSAQRELRRLQLGEPVASKLQAAGDALRQLQPYYDDNPI
jgi:hypothetical protein